MNYLILIIACIIGACLYSLFKAGPRSQFAVDMKGKVVIVTGSSAGIGKETARRFAQLQATVVFACRNRQKTLPIIEEIKKETKNEQLHFLELELSDFASVRKFVAEFRRTFRKVNILINNAGLLKDKLEFNQNGYEMLFTANHLGHFLLTELMLDVVEEGGRIINVSSEAHNMIRKPFSWEDVLLGKKGAGWAGYAYSKLANVAYTIDLEQRVAPRNIHAFSLHPGLVKTEIFTTKNINNWLAKAQRGFVKIFGYLLLTEEQGSWCTVHCALADLQVLIGGAYYDKSKVKKHNKLADDPQLLKQLIEVSRRAVNL